MPSSWIFSSLHKYNQVGRAAITELACLTQRSLSDCRVDVMRSEFWTQTKRFNETHSYTSSHSNAGEMFGLLQHIVGHASWIKQMKWSETITSIWESRTRNPARSSSNCVCSFHSLGIRMTILESDSSCIAPEHTSITQHRTGGEMIHKFTWLSLRTSVCRVCASVSLCLCVCKALLKTHCTGNVISPHPHSIVTFVLIPCSNCCTDALLHRKDMEVYEYISFDVIREQRPHFGVRWNWVHFANILIPCYCQFSENVNGFIVCVCFFEIS